MHSRYKMAGFVVFRASKERLLLFLTGHSVHGLAFVRSLIAQPSPVGRQRYDL